MNLIVTSDKDGAWLDWGAGKRRAAIGPGGIALKGGEGDGITPRGTFPIREVFYRADRVKNLQIALPLWNLPYPANAENMWREDHLYDVVAVIGFNDDPVYPGKGSAIFLHYAKPDYTPTAGCVALARDDLLAALEQFQPGDVVRIG